MDNRDIFRAASGVCLVVASELTHISGRNCLLAADERDVGLSPLRSFPNAANYRLGGCSSFFWRPRGLMTTIAFVSAVLALLLAPGPTNTLMGLAGAQGGLVRVIRLIPAELAGYAMAILPLSFLGAAIFQTVPGFESVIKGAAAVWVAILAIRLWRSISTAGQGKKISVRRVFITTWLNPKALVFSLVLLPSPQAEDFVPHLALFAVLAIGVALVWGSLGVMTQISATGIKRLIILQRVASAWLMFVSVSLIVNISLG